MPRVVRIGNGAGYQGDRIPPAVELVRHGSLDFLFLECLAERTLATAHRRMSDGGTGYSRLADWMEALLPIAHERGVRIVTNMGAADPEGGGRAAAEIAARLGLPIKVAACGEVLDSTDDSGSSRYTYLGADVVKQALDSGADFVITGRVADPSLLVGCVAHAFNWDLADGSRGNLDRIARATAAGHLLECGQQLTGGYFAHPRGRDMGWEALRHISQPMADLDAEGYCILRKLSGSGGELSPRSCAQQLIYEVGDPAAYLTPDCAADFTAVNFRSLSADAVQVRGACAGVPAASGGIQRTPTLLRLNATRKGVKQSAEFSVGGSGCMQRGVWADRLVRQWMEEAQPFSTKKMMTYFQGWNALYMQVPPFSHGGHPSTIEPYIDLLASGERREPTEVRIRWDGVFESKEQAHVLTDAVGGLALGGPAGIGSGLGPQPSLAVEIISIGKELVPREDVKWALWEFCEADVGAQVAPHAQGTPATQGEWNTTQDDGTVRTLNGVAVPDFDHASFAGAAPAPEKMAMVPEPAQPVPSEACTVQLYDIAHGRSGDKGNTVNISVIPYDPADLPRLRTAITPGWVTSLPALQQLVDASAGVSLQASVYTLSGCAALNIVVSPVLDGGVSVSRRIDIHGKSFSDLILQQRVRLPAQQAFGAAAMPRL